MITPKVSPPLPLRGVRLPQGPTTGEHLCPHITGLTATRMATVTKTLADVQRAQRWCSKAPTRREGLAGWGVGTTRVGLKSTEKADHRMDALGSSQAGPGKSGRGGAGNPGGPAGKGPASAPELGELIFADTVLVGHSLESDLRARRRQEATPPPPPAPNNLPGRQLREEEPRIPNQSGFPPKIAAFGEARRTRAPFFSAPCSSTGPSPTPTPLSALWNRRLLPALKLVHDRVIDTAVLFGDPAVPAAKPSLRLLARPPVLPPRSGRTSCCPAWGTVRINTPPPPPGG